MPALVVSPKSAIALRKLLRTARTIIPNQGRGERGRVPLLVRCTSATAAGGSGISAECYPAVVVDPVSDELLADQPELGDVWLTLVDGSVPTADAIYQGVLSGEHTEGSDTRPRVFAAPSGMGGSIIRSWKEPVRAATTVADGFAFAFDNGSTIDGVVLATGDRILIKNQANQTENGIYTVNASGAPTRATDADDGTELVGAAVVVTEGTTNADTVWLCTTNAPITLGASNLVWARLSTSITVKELDGSPTLFPVSELQFNQGNGFVVSSPGAGQAQVNMAAASPTQVGVVTITTQTLGGTKNFQGGTYAPSYSVSIVAGGFEEIGRLYSSGFEAGGMVGTGPALLRPGPTPASFPHAGTFVLTWSTPNNEYIAMLRSSGGFRGNSPGVRFAVGGETSGISGVSLGQYATIPGVGTFAGGILISVSGGQIINGGSF